MMMMMMMMMMMEQAERGNVREVISLCNLRRVRFLSLECYIFQIMKYRSNLYFRLNQVFRTEESRLFAIPSISGLNIPHLDNIKYFTEEIVRSIHDTLW